MAGYHQSKLQRHIDHGRVMPFKRLGISMTDNLQQETTNLIAPGKILRDTREVRRLSQAEIASRLHLSLQIIKDIESDDYSRFPAAIYVRGYLRNYAALLEMNSEPLLHAFDVMGFADEIKRQPHASYVSSSVAHTVNLHRSRSQLARRASWIILGLFITLVVIWWYGQHQHKHATISASLLSPSSVTPDAQQVIAIPMTTVVKPDK